jgi:hypothetical protein
MSTDGHRRSFFYREFWPLMWALVLSMAVQVLEFKGWMAGIEGKVLDYYQASFTRAPLVVLPVVVLEIDEKGYRDLFDGKSPLNPQGLLSLIDQTLMLSNPPKAIGVDILTDFPEFGELYRAWARGYGAAHPGVTTRLVWAAGEPAAAHDVRFLDWFLGREPLLAANATDVLGDLPNHLPPPLTWATPIFPRDEDLALRRYPRVIDNRDAEPPERPSWAAAVGQAYRPGAGPCGAWSCPPPEEVILSYSVAPYVFKLSDVFERADKNHIFGDLQLKASSVSGSERYRFEEYASGGVVLIGGAFNQSTRNDYHDTPRGDTPGVELNAYAVQSEIAGAGAREAWHPLLVAGDLVFAVLIVYLFSTAHTFRKPILLTILLVVGVAILSRVMFAFQYVWLSWIGMFIGMWPHIVMEVFGADATIHHHD